MHPHPGRPWVIAHRGASAAAPENTVAAFRLAAELGADAVELDARRTADGALVVHHDDVVSDRPIVSLTRTELEALAPEVPTLETALDACRGMWVNVEIKNSPFDADWDPEHRLLPDLLEIVACSGVAAEVSSFNPLTIAAVREAAPDVPTGWLFEAASVALPDAIEAAAAAGHRAVHPDIAALAEAGIAGHIEAAHAAGLWVIGWTIDDPGEMTRLADAGIDGIITNVPDIAVEVLADRGLRPG